MIYRDAGGQQAERRNDLEKIHAKGVQEKASGDTEVSGDEQSMECIGLPETERRIYHA